MINIAYKNVAYETSGSQNTFAFPFDYINKTYVKATLNGVALTYGDDYTVNGKEIFFMVAPTGYLEISRSTPTDRLVEWNEGSVLLRSDMELSQLQQLHLVEEGNDWSKNNSIVLNDEEENWEGRHKRLGNILDPIEPNDVVTKGYMETIQTGFVQKNTTLAQEATTAANTATAKASEASASAVSASASATSASTSANTATAKASEATASAVSASASAETATTKAQEIIVSATSASTSANTAIAKASEATKASNEAKGSENAAKGYATQAAENARIAMNAKNETFDGNWKANEEVKVGDIRFLGGRENVGYVLECIQAGTTGATQPTFTADDVEPEPFVEAVNVYATASYINKE